MIYIIHNFLLHKASICKYVGFNTKHLTAYIIAYAKTVLIYEAANIVKSHHSYFTVKGWLILDYEFGVKFL